MSNDTVSTANPHFAATLLRWFSIHRRPLPWRETRDPYPVWLSEIILQQTRIQQGQAYWERFMHRWPTVGRLAAATEDEVLREWQGLGYYSRARHLHAAAKMVADMGRFPSTYDEIRGLPGVGDYTAAAVASIAFDLPHAVVDGNVYRVLSRYFGIETPIDSTAGKHTFAALAQSLLPPDRASDFNQAMMDFGALQCTPQSPRCLDCPLSDTCDALHTGRTSLLPVRQKKTAVQTRHFSYVYVRLLPDPSAPAATPVLTALRRRPSGDIWQGLWEPLLFEETTGIDVPALFPDSAHGCADGARPWRLSLLQSGVRHVLTHRIILADFYLLETRLRPSLPGGYVWVPEPQLSAHALPRLVERLLQGMGATEKEAASQQV